MKVNITYDLPEEKSEIMLAMKGGLYHSMLWELDKSCRSYLKHGHNFESPDDVLEWVREEIANNVDLDEVD